MIRGHVCHLVFGEELVGQVVGVMIEFGRVAVGLLPQPLARPLARLEPYGMLILMGLASTVFYYAPFFIADRLRARQPEAAGAVSTP